MKDGVQEPKTFQCYQDDTLHYKQILHSFIHSFNIYLLRACYMYKAKIKQNNTISNKYKRQKKKKKRQIEFISDDCSKTHRVKDSLLLFLQIPPGFQLFRYIVS